MPEVQFVEKADEADKHNSRKIQGIMSTERRDRQGEIVVAKGLDFDDFLKSGHFNDNHSQETSAIIGYPEKVEHHKSLAQWGIQAPGWTCEGYMLKGTKRSDGIWELAHALSSVPNKKLGFSIEGKVERRKDKTIEKAKIRNVAITNCPVNTDCTWDLLNKSFDAPDIAEKAMMAGFATSPATQSGGGAMRAESLESDSDKRKKKRVEALKRALAFDDMVKAIDVVMDMKPEFDEDAAAMFVQHLYNNGGKL